MTDIDLSSQKSQKLALVKCRAKVGYDAVQETKMVKDLIEELGCPFCGCLDQRLVLDPLGEFIDANIYIVKTPWGWLEWSNHVQSLACKGPKHEYRL